MKLFLLLSLFFTSTVLGQTRGKPIEGNYCQGVSCESNLVINPSAEKNALNVTVNNATATRGTGLADGLMINGKGVWIIDASALNGYVQFDLNAPLGDQTSTSLNCAYSGSYNGDASLYSAYLVDGSNNVLVSQQLTNTASTWKEFKLNASCAAAGQRKVRLVQTSAGTAPAFYAGKITYGRSDLAMGTIVTKSDEYQWTPTVTGLGSGSGTATGRAGRVGDRLVGTITFTKDATNGTGTSNVQFSLPGGLVVGTGGVAGDVYTDTTNSLSNMTSYTYGGTSYIVMTTAGAVIQGSNVTANSVFVLNFSIPISGWTAGARVSDGYDGQDVVFSATGTSTTAFTTTPTNVTFNTDIRDTTNSYSSGVYTVKSAGAYPVDAQLDVVAGTFPAGGTVVLAIYKNSTEVYSSFSRNATDGTLSRMTVPPKVSGTVHAVAGDTISVKAYGASGLTSFTAGSSKYTYISISKKSGAAYITPEGRNVTSKANNTGLDSAYMTCNAGSTIHSNPGSWVSSIGNIASGACTVTLTTGRFSASPHCFTQYVDTSTGYLVQTKIHSATASSLVVLGAQQAGGTTSVPPGYSFYLFCKGAN